MIIGRVFVMPKQEVLDPQGQAVRHSLHALGYAEVRDVRVGKYLEVEIAGEDVVAAGARLEAMCEGLLANRVIEEYRIEVAAESVMRAAAGARRGG
jgi:phosphoribosylformylglycinamidine synthase